MAKLGITGNPLKWINELLENRTFQIKIGNKTSKKGTTKCGVPQGSPISPVLFNIMINDLKLTGIEKIIYADDITLIISKKNLIEAANKLETELQKLKEWANTWDLKINFLKSKLLCFTNKKINHLPTIKMDNTEIKYVQSHKILGLTLDAPKLKWKNHINNIKVETLYRINLMKKLASFNWGANRETLIKFYKIYIKPKIEYGITIYGAAKEGEIKKIEILQNQVLRLATGCLNSTPIIALQALTNLPPMKDRKKELEYIHLTKILNKPNRMPIKQQTINYIKEYNPQRDKRSLFHRVTETNKILNIELKINEVPTTSPVPPWFDISNYIQINFAEELTKNTPQVVIQKYYQEMININYKDYTKIFTDGSKIKEPESTSAAIFIQDKEITSGNYQLI